MKTVCNKNLDVFDFKDESPGVVLRISSKLEKSRSSAIDKYTFLATAAAGEHISAEKLKYVPSLGIDAINITHMATTLIEDSSPVMAADLDDAFTVAEQSQPQITPELRTDLSESELNVATTSTSLPSHHKSNSVIRNLLPSLPEIVASDDPFSRSKSHLKCSQKHDEAVEMDSDENQSLCERSSSSPDVAEYSGQDTEDITSVVFYPDYVVYHDSYYTDSLISFTSTSIKLEASTTDGNDNDRIFKFEWRIEEILDIRSHWHEQVEMAMMVIYILTKDKIHNENANCTSVTELKFPIIGSQSYERIEAIASLNVIYKAKWTSMLESEDTMFGHNGEPFPKYIPNFGRPFEEVVYPKGDADAVSISKRDFDLLQPDTFVNDTIIDFFIKYLKNNMKGDERQRFHFFNSFFFRKLADPDKDPILDASKGREAFLRVKKWTRNVNLFEKDYVFIPVNYNYHWSLIVICHLGDVATYKDEDVYKSMRVPCVLHMDSLRGTHTGLKGLLQSYLKEEWRERNQGDENSRFDNLRFISLELPQQQNSFDCGLFLLHYVQLFLEEAPLHFNPFKITESSNFLKVDWFPPSDASLKRRVIQKLICDLLDHQSKSSLTPTKESECRDDPCIASGSNQTSSIDELKTPIQEEGAIQQENEMMGNDFVSWKKKKLGLEKKRDYAEMVTSCMDMDL